MVRPALARRLYRRGEDIGRHASEEPVAHQLDAKICAQRIAEIRRIRQWQIANLPIYGTLLGLDVVQLILQRHLERAAFQLKDIYLTLPYSPNAIRMHLQRLAHDRWIILQSWDHDRRARRLFLTPKMRRALNEYLQMVLAVGADDPTPSMRQGPAKQTRLEQSLS